MVDVQPWGGDYSGTIVRDNFIIGGLADPTDGIEANTGTNADGVIMKYDSLCQFLNPYRSLTGLHLEWASPSVHEPGSSTSLVRTCLHPARS